MILGDLYTRKPTVLDISVVHLLDGRLLTDVLEGYSELTLPQGKRIGIGKLKRLVTSGVLSKAQQDEIANLEIDETSLDGSNLPELTTLDDVGGANYAQNFAIVVSIIMLAIITLAYTFFWGWLVYTEHVKPPFYPMVIVIFPWVLVVWKSQGIISRERRDVISVLFGDTANQKGLWDKISDVSAAMKNK